MTRPRTDVQALKVSQDEANAAWKASAYSFAVKSINGLTSMQRQEVGRGGLTRRDEMRGNGAGMYWKQAKDVGLGFK